MKLRNKLSWGGLVKIALDRFRVYMTYVSTYWVWQIKENAIKDGWTFQYTLLVVASLIIIYLDIRYMFRGEQQAAFDVHPYMPKMRDDIAAIKEKVDELSHLQQKS